MADLRARLAATDDSALPEWMARLERERAEAAAAAAARFDRLDGAEPLPTPAGLHPPGRRASPGDADPSRHREHDRRASMSYRTPKSTAQNPEPAAYEAIVGFTCGLGDFREGQRIAATDEVLRTS